MQSAQGLRFASNKSRIDFALGFLLALVAFFLYVQTLVPSILDGDQGELQYMPSILGIPHPPGFPLYLLLGHLWSLLPIGDLAYRMNLFSAIFGALTIGALFVVLRRQGLHLVAALGAFTFALIPTFWNYSTLAAVYTLHTFLAVLLLGFLLEWQATRRTTWISLAGIILGLGVSNHPTFLLFAPATVAYALGVGGLNLRSQLKNTLSAAIGILPCLFYLYIPLRAQQLVGEEPSHLQDAIAKGIISPFYENSPTGLLHYLTAQSFTRTMISNWKWDTLMIDFGEITFLTVNWPVLILALVGIVWLIATRWKLAAWLIIVFVSFSAASLQYQYALVAAGDFAPYFQTYLFPSWMALIIFQAAGIHSIFSRMQMPKSQGGSKYIARTGLIVLSIAMIVSWVDLGLRHSAALTQRSLEMDYKWAVIRQFPPEQDAAIVGHWGDLTPLWYLQTAEGWRHDLVAIDPPTDLQVDEWLATGKPLYLAGPLLGWAPEIEKRYYLTGWGPLVRVDLRDHMLPSPFNDQTDFVFSGKTASIRLGGYDFSRDFLHSGDAMNLSLYWEYLADISLDDTLVFISLENSNNTIDPESFSLVANWLPGKRLFAGQRGLGTYHYLIPAEISPGEYSIRLRVYSIDESQNLRVQVKGQFPDFVDLGTINIE